MPTLAEAQALAAHFYQSRRFAEAEAVAGQILRSVPADAPTVHLLGLIALEKNQLDQALRFIQQSLALTPDNALFHSNLANVYLRLGQTKAAIASCEQSLRLDSKNPLGHVTLALIYREMGDYQRAHDYCQAAISLNPSLPGAWDIAATLLQLLGKRNEARSAYSRALELNPNNAETHNNFAMLLREQSALDESETHLREALRLIPNSTIFLNNLGGVLQNQGRLDEALACFRRAQTLNPGDFPTITNLLLCLNYLPEMDGAALFREHVTCAERIPKPARFGPAPDHDRNPDRRLRIGCVSADFSNHVVSQFLLPIFEHHDPQQIEIVGYAQVLAPDSMTARYQKPANAWRSIVGKTDNAVADQIRADRIDILVDLSGYTSGSRLPVFAHKPAPVQVTYLGFPGTTGLQTIDYRLTDGVADPWGDPLMHSEKLFRLPGAFFCMGKAENVPDVSPLPAERNGYVTFGSLHNLARINDRVLDLWCDLLKTMPASRLILFRDTLRGKVRDRFFNAIVSRGISADRIDLQNTVRGPGSFPRVYHEIDISLDTFPWSGHSTACQSLWMGVPIVTLRGNRHAGRMVSSLLHHAGLGELIAENREQYIRLAIALASGIPALAQMRRGLREKFAKSSICDAARFTRGLEEAYRAIWRHYCSLT